MKSNTTPQIKQALILFTITLIFTLSIPTAYADEEPVSIAGYLDSQVTTNEGGMIIWLGVLPEPPFENSVEIYYQGLPTGLEAQLQDPNAGVYRLVLNVPPGVPPMQLMFGVKTSGTEPQYSTSYWPYFSAVKEITPTPTAIPTETSTQAPTETPTMGFSPTPSPTDTPIVLPTPYFENISYTTGIRGYDSKRMAFYDIDGDGWLDILMNLQHVLMNRPNGSGGREFVDMTDQSGINWEDPDQNYTVRKPNVVLMGDVDNDGDVDLYSGMYLDFDHPSNPTPDYGWRSTIFLNDGNGVFTMLNNSGLEGNPGTECAATFFDYDNDGCLDLAVGFWYRFYGASYRCYSDRLYKGNCDGTFTDVTASTIETMDTVGQDDSARPVYGAAHSDWNNDGWQDLFFLTYGRQRNFHWRNNGDGTFTNVADLTNFEGDFIRTQTTEPSWRQHGNTFSCGIADFDNSGTMDMILGEITHSWATEASDKSQILVNLGPDFNYAYLRTFRGTTRDHPNPRNWNQGDIHTTWIDFNNDGLADPIIASGDYPDGQYLKLWEQRPGGMIPGVNEWFWDVTDLADFNWESSAAISVGDWDRDGDQDIIAGRSLMRMPAEKRQAWGTHGALFDNLVGNLHHWVTIQLEGKGQGFSNRQGIGARVEVLAGGVRHHAEINGGAGHVGQINAQEAHIGLGSATHIDEILIRWPNAAHTVQTFQNVDVDRIYIIRESDSQLYEWTP